MPQLNDFLKHATRIAYLFVFSISQINEGWEHELIWLYVHPTGRLFREKITGLDENWM